MGVAVHVIGAGTTTITASSEGRSASIKLRIEDPPISNVLEVLAISVLEFRYGPSDQWYYAPQLRIKGPAGSSGATFVAFVFNIPAIGPGGLCTPRLPVASGHTIEVFQDLEMSRSQLGVRASAREASGIIYILDANGRLGQIPVVVPVVTGSVPAYTGQILPLTCRGMYVGAGANRLRRP